MKYEFCKASGCHMKLPRYQKADCEEEDLIPACHEGVAKTADKLSLSAVQPIVYGYDQR